MEVGDVMSVNQKLTLNHSINTLCEVQRELDKAGFNYEAGRLEQLIQLLVNNTYNN